MIAWQEPPAQVQMLAEAEALGGAMTDAIRCADLQLVVVQRNGMNRAVNTLLERAEDADISHASFSAAVDRGASNARTEWSARASAANGPAGPELEASRAALVEFAVGRCRAVIENHPGFVSPHRD